MKNEAKKHTADWLSYNQVYEILASKYELSFGELSVLIALEMHHFKTNNHQLVLDTGLSKQTISTITQKMYKKGYFSFEQNPADKRSRLIIMTDKGNKTLGKILTAVHKFEQQAIDEFGKDNIRLLNKLNGHLLSIMKSDIAKVDKKNA